MWVAVCERYGPPKVVTIREVPRPQPADGEVLIEAHATSVNSGDARMRAARFPRGMAVPVRLALGVTKPRKPIFGFDVAGRVEAVGKDVTEFQVGDRVVASRGFDLGTHAEHVAVAEDGAIAPIPEGVGYQDAVAVCFGGMTALHFLGQGKLADGESLLINGAAGAVGVMAIQLANRTGAEVTAVCSAAHAELVTSLGAHHVVDYASEDFTRNGRRYGVIMDNHGNAPYARVKDSLAPEGRLLMVIGDLWQTLGATWRKDVVSGTAAINAESLRTLMALAASGELKPVIDSVFPFEQIAGAHRRVDTGHKAGSVVVAFDHDDD